MESDYRIAAVWIGLALIASLTAVRLKQSVTLIEILVGVVAGNLAVYAVTVETGLNETELGKVILAARFVTDIGTVVALGACFAHYDRTLIAFFAVMLVVLPLTPRVIGGFFARHANRVSEPGFKLIFGVLFGLGALAAAANSEAVLPADLIGLALAGVMARQRDAVRRMRTTVLALTTPFYFLLANTKMSLLVLFNWTGSAWRSCCWS